MLFEVTLFGPSSAVDQAQRALQGVGYTVIRIPSPYGPDGPMPPDPAAGAAWLQAQTAIPDGADQGAIQDHYLTQIGNTLDGLGFGVRIHGVTTHALTGQDLNEAAGGG